MHVCVFYAIRGRGGGGGGRRAGVDFQECVWSLVSPLVEKNTGTFFDTKRVSMPNFSGFLATWKNRNEIGTYASLPRSPSIDIWNSFLILIHVFQLPLSNLLRGCRAHAPSRLLGIIWPTAYVTHFGWEPWNKPSLERSSSWWLHQTLLYYWGGSGI